MPFETFKLANGIKLIHKYIDSPVAYCALIANTGSRDEQDDESGVAHLVEHLIFKETNKRKSHHILSRLENVGGELNAYTTKEETCVHAAFLSNYYARALDLMSDLMFNQKITGKTLELEKKVVLDEIRSCKDNPSELIFDEFDTMMFPLHSLGYNTLGTEKSVKALSKKTVERFIECNYFTNEIIISSIGKISFQQLIKYSEKYFGNIPVKERVTGRVRPSVASPFERRISRKTHQAHCVLGTVCNGNGPRYRMGMTMLANILGGPGMNTRLNISLREKTGWVYHVESSYISYSDIGIFNTYFGTERSNLEKCIKRVEQEIIQLKNKRLSDFQMNRLRQQMIGQFAIAFDNSEAQMLSAGKNFLMFDKTENLSDIIELINDINAVYLQDLALESFNSLSFLIYQ